MKKLSFLLMMMIGLVFTNAQEGTNWLKLGAHAGIPVGDAGDVSSFALGIDGKYQFLTYNHFGIGVATGYSHFFQKDDNNVSFGIVPLAALLRYYPTERFFLGADLGYGFLTGDAEDGGFYYRPEIGYHDEKWNVFGFYQGVAADGFAPAQVGVGVNFNVIQRAPAAN